MSQTLCSLQVQSEFIVIQRSATSNTGSSIVRVSHNSTGADIDISVSTTCAYQQVAAGTVTVPQHPLYVDIDISYDTNGYSDDCRGIQLCGEVTITSTEDGCEDTITIPVYIWTICDTNDWKHECFQTMPEAIWIDKQDPTTWDAIIAFIPDTQITYWLDINNCPYITDYDNGAIVPDRSGGAFSVTFDLSTFTDCGDDLLACEISLFGREDGICEARIPVYVTNSCPEFECPIDINPLAVSINKNAGDTGAFTLSIINNQSYEVTLSGVSGCPYVVVPSDPTVLAGSEMLNVSFDYDLTNFQTCGETPCGDLTFTATYAGAGGETLTCQITVAVSISYECDEEEGGYETLLEDNAGNSTVVIDDDCEQITVIDNSGGFTESGHSMGAFTKYRTITITHLQTGGVYVLSSIAGADELIPALQSGVVQFFHDVTDGGIYQVVLCNVPTWNVSASYQDNDDVVYWNDQLYGAITNNQGQTPNTNADDWTPITEAQIGDYSGKYCATKLVLSSCSIEDCFANNMHEILCELNCNLDDLCKNKELMDMVKFIFLLTALEEALDQDDWDAVILIYDKITQICTC